MGLNTVPDPKSLIQTHEGHSLWTPPAQTGSAAVRHIKTPSARAVLRQYTGSTLAVHWQYSGSTLAVHPGDVTVLHL